MNYDFKKIRDEVYTLVEETDKSKNNLFQTAFEFHILPVVRHSLNLGKVLQADLEVLELSALLHDYPSILDVKYYPEHHIYGAKFAEDILEKTDFPQEKIELVKKCILNHRGSVLKNKESLEEKIIASADAMAHISDLNQMFYLAFKIHQKEKTEGVEFIKKKLKNSWNKIELEEGRKMVEKDFETAQYILNQNNL